MYFDLIKAGATQTETSLLKQYAAGERVDLLDDYDFPVRTITERKKFFFVHYPLALRSEEWLWSCAIYIQDNPDRGGLHSIQGKICMYIDSREEKRKKKLRTDTKPT